MNIEKLGSEIVRQDGVRKAQEEDERRVGAPLKGVEGAARSDRVEISEEGRALAAHLDVDLVAPEGNFTPEEMQAIREKIVGGHYNKPEVVAEVARRILLSDDMGGA